MMANPIAIQMAINTSRCNNPHCFTKSALEKNLTASASSKKPNTTFTVVNHPPDFGNDCSQPGKRANKANGNARPKPNPPIPKDNCVAPPSFDKAPANKEPRIGPVQEKETMANVSAIKKMPQKSLRLERESILLAKPPGRPIS